MRLASRAPSLRMIQQQQASNPENQGTKAQAAAEPDDQPQKLRASDQGVVQRKECDAGSKLELDKSAPHEKEQTMIINSNSQQAINVAEVNTSGAPEAYRSEPVTAMAGSPHSFSMPRDQDRPSQRHKTKQQNNSSHLPSPMLISEHGATGHPPL